MNISTYESKINALEAGGGGGGGSSDELFVITIDYQNMTCDKTFSEVRNAVLNNAVILTNMGGGTFIIPDTVQSEGDDTDIYIYITLITVNKSPTLVGTISTAMVILHPDNRLEAGSSNQYTFVVTEVE